MTQSPEAAVTPPPPPTAQAERRAFADTPWDDLPLQYLGCSNELPATQPVDISQLSPQDYISLLSAPQGVQWPPQDAPKSTPVDVQKIKRNKKRLIHPPEQQYVREFLSEVVRIASPQTIRKLLTEEFGLSPEEVDLFIKEQKSRKKGDSILNLEARSPWLQEYKRIMRVKLIDYVATVMASRRSKRTRYIAATFLKHFCDLTGENCNLNNPQNRVQRIQVFIADRLAAWCANIMAETDKELCKDFLEKSGKFDQETDEKETKPSDDKKKKRKVGKGQKRREQKGKEDEQKRIEEEKKKKKQQEEKGKKQVKKGKAKKGAETEDDKRRKEEEEKRKRQVEEEKRKKQEEEKRKKQEEEKRKKQGEEKRKKPGEEKRKKPGEGAKGNYKKGGMTEDEKIRQEQEAKRKKQPEEEKRKKQEAERKRKGEEKIKKGGEEEINKEEEDTRKKEEEEGKTKMDEEEISKEEEEKRKMEEEARKKEEEEAGAKGEEDELKKGEEEGRSKEEEEKEGKVEGEEKEGKVGEEEKEGKVGEEEKEGKVGEEEKEGKVGEEEKMKEAETREGAGDMLSPDPLDMLDEWVKEPSEGLVPGQDRLNEMLLKDVTQELGRELSPEEEKVVTQTLDRYSKWIGAVIDEAQEQLKTKKVTYHIKRAKGKCYYDVKKVDEKEVCGLTKAARMEKVALISESICKRPNNTGPIIDSKELKEWYKWVADVVGLAEKWVSWIDKTCNEAEAKVKSGTELDPEKEKEWIDFKKATEVGAVELRRNKKYVKETAKMWDEKISSKRQL